MMSSSSLSEQDLSLLESTMGSSSMMMEDGMSQRVEPKRFKTKMCRNFMKDGHCPYEDRCMFAHGTLELRTTDRNERDGLVTEDLVKKFQTMVMLRRKFNANRPPPTFEEILVPAPATTVPIVPAPVAHYDTCSCPSCKPVVQQQSTGCQCPNCVPAYPSYNYYTHNPYSPMGEDLYETYAPSVAPNDSSMSCGSSYYSTIPCVGYGSTCTCPQCLYTASANTSSIAV